MLYAPCPSLSVGLYVLSKLFFFPRLVVRGRQCPIQYRKDWAIDFKIVDWSLMMRPGDSEKNLHSSSSTTTTRLVASLWWSTRGAARGGEVASSYASLDIETLIRFERYGTFRWRELTHKTQVLLKVGRWSGKLAVDILPPKAWYWTMENGIGRLLSIVTDELVEFEMYRLNFKTSGKLGIIVFRGISGI